MTRYEVLTNTLSGWENTWTDEFGDPETFGSVNEAEKAIREFLRDMDDAVALGHMSDRPAREDFKINKL